MKIVPVVRRAKLKEIDEKQEDVTYWLSRPPEERIAAVTKLIQMHLEAGQRMDKTHVVRRKMHP